MKVGFFFENGERDEGRDLRSINVNNPGLGGTPFMFYLIAHLLAVRDNDIEVTFFSKYCMNFVAEVHTERITSLADTLTKCEQQHISYLIIKDSENCWETIKEKEKEIKIIIWCHNFVPFRRLTNYAKSDVVARLVCVGREQADIYRDHRAFKKTDWIYNCISNDLLQMDTTSLTPFLQRQPFVTYMGAVVPGKGFHLLAKVWPSVLKAVPDAQLYVIGSAKLYSGNPKLGPYGLAEKHYEETFMKYLTDKKGQLLPSVHLMGVLGKEKYDILAKTKVGVPNPSGLTETFCISAVEMQMMGAAIASRRCTGYMDTVKNGILIENPKNLASCITECLLCSEDRYAETHQAIKENFSSDVVASQWEKLLKEAIPQNKRLHPLSPLINPDLELKKWKETLRKLKEQHPWLYVILPSLGFFTELWKAAKWAIWKRTILR